MALSLLTGKAAVAGNGAPHPRHFAWALCAPRRVCEADDVRTSGKGWRSWAEHLRTRARPGKLNKLWKGRTSPLLWGWRQRELGPESAALLVRLHDFARKKGRLAGHVEGELRAWLDTARGVTATPALALEATAWTMVLPRLAGTAAPAQWWSAWEFLVDLGLEAANSLDVPPLPGQLLGGELGLALAFQFPELAVSGQLAEQARQTLDDGARTSLDGTGMGAGRELANARALLACWTRAYTLGRGIDGKFWAPTVSKRLRSAMLHALHWTRRDGSAVFDEEDDARLEPAFLERLNALFGSRRGEAEIKCWLPGYRTLPEIGAKHKPKRKLPDPAVHSEWGQATLMRSDWSRSAATFAVLWHEPALKMEFSIGNEVLALGDWRTEIRRNGELAAPSSAWEEVCWLSDDDGVYLELEQQLGPGLSLQRQLLLAREDRFLLIADAVQGATSARFDYSASWPLLPHVAYEPAAETTEGALNTRHGAFRVLPLALPEWRSAARGCELSQTAHGFTLRQSQIGTSFFAPIWIDLDPRRQAAPCTWRQLTVAEDRHILPRDAAVGYRVQVGRQQWIVYRSLGERGNRTLLGHNLITEYLVARFERNGAVDPIVEIE